MSSSEDEEVFTVERILSHKTSKNGAVTYLVKWENYPLSESTWEPEENVFCREIISQYFRDPKPNLSRAKLVRDELLEQEKQKDREKIFEEDEKIMKRKSLRKPPVKVVKAALRAAKNAEDQENTKKFNQTPKIHQESRKDQTQNEGFDLKSFLKLGFTVSAVIVLIFIIIYGGDEFYINRYLLQQFRKDLPQSDRMGNSPPNLKNHQ